MQWVEITSEVEHEQIQQRIIHALEIPGLGCIMVVNTEMRNPRSNVETTTFVPGVCIQDNKLVVIEGFGQYTPPVVSAGD